MQAGAEMSAREPLNASLPESCAIRSTATVCDLWFATSMKRPEGSIAKCLGVRPWDGACSTTDIVPDDGSTATTAITSLPRTEP